MTPSTSFALRKTADFAAAASPAAIALGVALAIAPTWARAETQVHGTPQAVVVEAQNATIEEILVALTDTFKVQFKSAANLDKRLTGTYQGTLQQAVSHILKGYDFVVKSGQAGLEITLLGAGKPVAVVGARPATKVAEAAPAAALQPTPTATRAVRTIPSRCRPPADRRPRSRLRRDRPRFRRRRPGHDGASPVPQVGSGPAPSPMPPQPGAAPTPVPPLPTASSAAPPPTAIPSTVAPPAPTSAPAPSPPVAAPTAPTPPR